MYMLVCDECSNGIRLGETSYAVNTPDTGGVYILCGSCYHDIGGPWRGGNTWDMWDIGVRGEGHDE